MTAVVAPYFDGSQPCASADPEAFFPEVKDWETTQASLAICDKCPFRTPCAEWAVTNRADYGIWGGLTEDDRNDMRHGRAPDRRRRGVQHGKLWTYRHHECRCAACVAVWAASSTKKAS